jgi:hypothetical protein
MAPTGVDEDVDVDKGGVGGDVDEDIGVVEGEVLGVVLVVSLVGVVAAKLDLAVDLVPRGASRFMNLPAVGDTMKKEWEPPVS